MGQIYYLLGRSLERPESRRRSIKVMAYKIWALACNSPDLGSLSKEKAANQWPSGRGIERRLGESKRTV